MPLLSGRALPRILPGGPGSTPRLFRDEIGHLRRCESHEQAGRELLDARFNVGGAKDCRDLLDGLGPHRREPSCAGVGYSSDRKRASATSPRSRSTSSGGAGWSIDSAMSAFPPRRVRETVMFAMFTPASPNSVPTRPITPGTSS